MSADSIDQMERIILELLEERGASKTICPSEAARRLAEFAGRPENWRAQLKLACATAIHMAQRGKLVVLQRGKPVDPVTARGAIRLRSVDG